MLKTEKKLIMWIEKHMFFLMALFAAAVGLYLRKAVIWWASPDASFYFDGHADNIQSAFYYLLVHLLQYLPMLPLHGMKFTALLMFAVLFVRSGGEHALEDCMEYVAWTTMTCAMLLPCMHERYNYTAEILLPVCAVLDRRLRFPAAALVLLSVLCYGQSYLGWSPVSHYALACGNLLLYFYLLWRCFYRLYGFYKKKETGMEAC